MDDLEHRWRTLAGTSPAAGQAGAELLRRWREPHRHYHDTTHLAAVLHAVDVLAPEARDLTAVRFAAWFHDAVYEGRPGADEEASAELAREMLARLELPADTVDEVVRLVLLTRTHDPAPGDADGAVLCDADLSVLGGSPEQYAAYTAAVRQDYAHVGDADFATGRIAVLERLLTADPLFRTRTGGRAWATRARHNMQAELSELRARRMA